MGAELSIVLSGSEIRTTNSDHLLVNGPNFGPNFGPNTRRAYQVSARRVVLQRSSVRVGVVVEVLVSVSERVEQQDIVLWK